MKVPFGYVYRIVNKITGESYIGQRKLSLDSYWRQYLGSGKLVKSAIADLGAENFTKTMIGYAESPASLSVLEEYWIVYEKDVLGRGEYNQTRFVNGPNVASKIGAEAASEKSKLNRENRYKEFLARNRQDQLLLLFEKNPTDLLLANLLNEPLSEIKRWMEEHGLENSQAFSGQVKSPVKKLRNKKTSESMKSIWNDPDTRKKIVSAQKGRSFSEEHRANLSKSHTRIERVEKRCLWCQKLFLPKKSRIQFCSLSCSSYARHRGIGKRS